MSFELTAEQQRLLTGYSDEVTQKDKKREGEKPEQAPPVSETHAHSRQMLRLMDQLTTARKHEDEERIQELLSQIDALKTEKDRQAWAESETAGQGGRPDVGTSRTTFGDESRRMGRNNLGDRDPSLDRVKEE
jgi:hypothetical protein